MDIIKYFKNFKEFIPTWVICIFMFVGVYVWPLIIGITLLIIQCVQRSKIKQHVQLLEQECHQVTTLSQDLKNKEFQISKLDKEIIELKDILSQKEDIIKQLQDSPNTQDADQKEKEYNEKLLYYQNEIDKISLCSASKYDSLRTDNKKNTFILCAGKYKGGIDIPVGVYNLKLLSGDGDFEINKPDNIYIWMRNDKCNQYNNLNISDKSILKIGDSAKIEFTLCDKYNYSQEIDDAKKEYEEKRKELNFEYTQLYNAIQTEIRTIRNEMRILNNKAISKYYIFSDYNDISSQDCKNKLSILKTKEKELRDSEEDIKILNNFEKKKLIERSIRQILRNFNSECDNIISHIKIKNIDLVRTRIQRSYETLNKLYYVDGVALSDKILSLKLEQATLLYTYGLKYQQEKDIQQAIKEQMMEEAKAEREIQEQKKKIEKDLQQHMSEIKRIMKYMQKTQIDAERQLYLDKIKELEEKVKLLESDKETVLEREANAKAGFVYIISNIGSFGEDIYKIGMTRRLEPMDRIKELSSASVPFEFDVHAMIFSSDAPAVETMLHKHFEKYAVNKINPRKEFYHVDIDEIEKVVLEEYNNTVQFTKIPLATEYRQSLAMQNKATG